VHNEAVIRFLIEEYATAPVPPLSCNVLRTTPLIVPTISARMAICPEKLVLEHKM
jgi:hypothetical protein